MLRLVKIQEKNSIKQKIQNKKGYFNIYQAEKAHSLGKETTDVPGSSSLLRPRGKKYQ